MPNSIFVKPVPGRKPRHETTHQPLSESGEYWADTPYARRRLRDGDIVKASPDESVVSPVASALVEQQTTVSPTITRKNKRSH